jgi:hypothetical protein
MNDSEQFDLPSDFGTRNATADCDSLRRLFIAGLVAMLIIGGSLNIFFLRQVVFMRKDLAAVRPQIQQVLANYQKTEDPQIKNFVNSLIAYGRLHPDFNPILTKYKLTTAAPVPTSSVAPTGVPTVPPPTNAKRK